MRKIVLITYLLTLLLAGGNKMHANVSSTTMHSASKWIIIPNHQEQVTSLNRTYLLIEYTDFDVDEEFSRNDNFKESKEGLSVEGRQSFFGKWYLCYNDTFDDASCNNSFCDYEPITGQSTPIYITYSVLRI
jgi:hypothetical protein